MLVYDGECGFCRRCADWVADRGEVPMAPYTEMNLDLVGLTSAEAIASVWWVSKGERLGGHRAITRVLRELGGGWGFVGRAIALPPLSWLGGPVYRWVAQNRSRFG